MDTLTTERAALRLDRTGLESGRAFSAETFDLGQIVQLTPAAPVAETSAASVDLGDVRLHWLRLRYGALLRPHAAPGVGLLGLIVKRSANVTLAGSSWRPTEIALLRAGSAELCTLGPGEFIWIEVRDGDFQRWLGVDQRLNEGEPAFSACGPTIELLRGLCRSVFGPHMIGAVQERKCESSRRIIGMLRRSIEFAAMRPRAGAARKQFELVQRAEAYSWAHVEEPLTLTQIADGLQCTRRTIAYAFFCCYGLPPMKLFRLQRLNSVRRALATKPAHRSIFDVAAEYGFWHQGHFGNAYRVLFGVTPSQTR